MSDLDKPQQPPASESAAAEAKPATPPATAAAKPAPAKAPAEPPPPPEPGEFGKQLAGLSLKTSVEHLGLDAGGIEMVRVSSEDALTVARWLRDSAQFDLLVSVSGLDWKDRLEAVYHFYSTETFKHFALKVNAVNEHVSSLTSVYPAADWHEREAFDLFGIVFDGHPNLKRILMPSDWIGYPMRKDYKVTDPRLVWNER